MPLLATTNAICPIFRVFDNRVLLRYVLPVPPGPSIKNTLDFLKGPIIIFKDYDPTLTAPNLTTPLRFSLEGIVGKRIVVFFTYDDRTEFVSVMPGKTEYEYQVKAGLKDYGSINLE